MKKLIPILVALALLSFGVIWGHRIWTPTFWIIAVGILVWLGWNIVKSEPGPIPGDAVTPASPSEALKKVMELAQLCITLIATVFGGFWVYDEFIASRQDAKLVEPTITHTIQEIPDEPNNVVLVLDVALKNLGKRRFDLDFEYGIQLLIEEITIQKSEQPRQLPMNVPLPSSPDDKPLNQPNPKVGNRPPPLEIDLAADSRTYLIEPGMTFHEEATVIVKRNSLYSVIVQFQEGTGKRTSLWTPKPFRQRKAKDDVHMWEQVVISTSPDIGKQKH